MNLYAEVFSLKIRSELQVSSYVPGLKEVKRDATMTSAVQRISVVLPSLGCRSSDRAVEILFSNARRTTASRDSSSRPRAGLSLGSEKES